MVPAPARIYAQPEPGPGLVALGFDPGIGSPGVAVVEKRGRGFRCLFHKVIRSRSSSPDAERYAEIVDVLSTACREFHPTIIVSEEQRTVQAASRDDDKRGKKVFVANSSKTIVTVGLCIAVARIYRVQCIEARTQTIRAAIMGKNSTKGMDKKQQKAHVQGFVAKVLGEQLAQDSAEAVLNAVYGLQLKGAR